MEYVIPAILVVLLVGGFVTFLALNATKKSGPAAKDDDVPGIGRDETPLGDTTEHAGEQSEEGTTRDDPESGGGPGRSDPAHVKRPGEAEGGERFEQSKPASERLADRDF